jgi:23S rRNA (cytosine1962-C5)-methyltransferase
VNRGQHMRGQRRGNPLPPLHRHSEAPPQQSLGSGGAEEDQNTRFERSQLRLQPRAAGHELQLIGLGVNAALPRPALPLEVLDRVGDVSPRARNAHRFESLIEHPTRRANEGVTLDVLSISGLLADEDEVRMGRSLPEDGLSGIPVEVASAAVAGGELQGAQSTLAGNPGGGRGLGGARGHDRTVCTHPWSRMPPAFRDRLRKNARHLGRWARREGITAWRIYDWDMPEFPFVVERYGPYLHLVEFPRRAQRGEAGQSLREEVLQDVVEVLEVAPEDVFTKTHLPQPWGRSQYGRLAQREEELEVREGPLRFWVNLSDRLDTGLFLDHRNTRVRVRTEATGRRMLNLFGYTGSFTVAAARGGAQSTTTVDLSATYLDWARRNLELNGVSGPAHELVRADCVRWLAEAARGGERWDLVVLDPPAYSTSKGMRGEFNVQRDHRPVLRDALALLAPGGLLYFSTNYRQFHLEPEGLDARFEELTPDSLPPDIHQRDIHRCWRVQAT